MATDIGTVITQSGVIRDETAYRANTAVRVGTNLIDLGENIKETRDKTKYISATATRHSIGTGEIYLGNGVVGVNAHLDNPATENGVFSGTNKAGGEWFLGSFPDSATHGDDIILDNPSGGIVLEYTTNLRARKGGVYKDILAVNAPLALGKVLSSDLAGVLTWIDSSAGCDMSSDQCAGVKGNTDLSATNHVVDMDLLFLHENNNLRHLSVDERGALSDAPRPLSAANPVVDTDTLQIYIDAHDLDFVKHMGTDQNNAFDGANSPSALNVLATMNDLEPFATHIVTDPLHLTLDMYGGLYAAASPSLTNAVATMNDIPAAAPAPPPPDLNVQVVLDNGIGTKPSKTECEAAINQSNTDRALLMKSAIKGWLVFEVDGEYFYEKLTRAV